MFIIVFLFASLLLQARDGIDYRAARSIDNMRNAGYTITSYRYDEGWLDAGHYRTYRVYLYGGQEYAFVGIGSYRINDLDIVVFDRNWNYIDSDEGYDNNPITEFIAPYTGTYRVRVKMSAGYGYYRLMRGVK